MSRSVLSATAPLDAELAKQIETQLDTTLLEMFGSTETCVIATRRTSSEQPWHLYPEVMLEPDAEGVNVNAPWFAAQMRLQDVIERQPGNRFVVRGRNADMVDVAGKRASLADLTRRLARDSRVCRTRSCSSRTLLRAASCGELPRWSLPRRSRPSPSSSSSRTAWTPLSFRARC